MARRRLLDIERAKGLAIILVIIGHLISEEFPKDNDWYLHLNLIIYKFHMAFFMYLTGFLMFYTYPGMRGFKDYVIYVKRKFVRLMPAFFLAALATTVGKMVIGAFAQLERPVSGLSEVAKATVFPPGYLWYIYVIFIYYLIIPILLKLFKQSLETLLVFAFAIHFMPRSPYFAQSQVFEFMFYFLLGAYAVRHRDSYFELIDRYVYLFMAVFVSCVLLYFVVDIPKLVFGVVSLPALHSLLRLRVCERMGLLERVGKYAFPIYLMNCMVTGFMIVVIQKYWSWDGKNFLVVAPVLFVSGLLLPIAVHKVFISKTPVLKTIIST